MREEDIYEPMIARVRPTVCVTRAGAGGGTPSDWENAEA
jgi:hypothetical protein